MVTWCIILLVATSAKVTYAGRNNAFVVDGSILAETKKNKAWKLISGLSGGASTLGDEFERDLVPVPPLDTDSTGKRARQALQDQANSEVFSNRMPSLFMLPEEQYLDKYAACLAATEGLRKLRDSKIEASRNTGNKKNSLKGLICGPSTDTNDPDYQQACAEYLMNSSKIIRALGLSVGQFNRIGREVGGDPLLKEKVLEQAYLYRITATLNMEKVPLMLDPSSQELLQATKRHRVQMFAKSMTEIEELRLEQTEKLKRYLNMERLPENLNISDPNIRPLLSSKVRAVVEAFPHQAEEIVRKYGLNSDEFNKMMEETQRNPMFRWKVKSYLEKNPGKKSSKASRPSKGTKRPLESDLQEP